LRAKIRFSARNCEKTDSQKLNIFWPLINHDSGLRQRAACVGGAILALLFSFQYQYLKTINLSARRIFVRSRFGQCERKRKLIQGFKRDAAFRNEHTKSQPTLADAWIGDGSGLAQNVSLSHEKPQPRALKHKIPRK